MATENVVGPTYTPSSFIRHPITSRNHDELEIPANYASYLNWDRTWSGYPVFNYVRIRAVQNGPKNEARYVTPTGFSLTTRKYGDFPEAELSASERGWNAYLNVGAPLIEERSDIIQPQAEVISEQIYVNRGGAATDWTDSVQFSISNSLSWSLNASTQLTFGGKITGSLQQQLQLSAAAKAALQQQQSAAQALGTSSSLAVKSNSTVHMHKDDMGAQGDNENTNTNGNSSTGTITSNTSATAEGTGTIASTTSATGTGELNGQLAFSIQSGVSGSLTSSWSQTSTLSGKLASRAVVRATQRRQVKRYDYQLPITMDGYVAMYYPEPVDVQSPYAVTLGMTNNERARIHGGNPDVTTSTTTSDRYTQVVVFPVSVLGIIKDSESYTQKGWAEVASTLVGEHEAFELETLSLSGRAKSDASESHLYRY